jgi:ABC-type Mn2+/Zn2+ transport system permease subunit
VFGFVASVLGLLGSVQFDMPAAPSILVTLTGLLVVMGGALGAMRLGNGLGSNAKR